MQIVTSAVRDMPLEWRDLPRFQLTVSIDGLQPEHDARRTPATYERILKNIAGHPITVHCTITRQQVNRPGYIEEFLDFWSARPEVQKIWYSLYTPQVGEVSDEILRPDDRQRVDQRPAGAAVRATRSWRCRRSFSPCTPGRRSRPTNASLRALTTTISADLTTRISPCQFGGTPDCSNCGCIASAGLAAIARHRLSGVIPVGAVLNGSLKIGERCGALVGWRGLNARA